ncbi:hypothetical protein RO07_24945 [Pandoraea pulmonicola]|uniref:Medium/long-chain acyl-CoA thioesterase YigI n=2 Tax=Pandoraea pulmonicola TaxID=93221 RepID=A0AAJ4ZG76_PANPU|nr:hypothetical protein RO07_24945 [Pandoraea pulmonicola]SUA92786.1 Uncharacterized protein, possibly involved in aromatic compounds catabolism [Pandoraea pulmonicola]
MIDVTAPHPPLSDQRTLWLARQFSEEPAYRHIGLRVDELARGKCVASVPIVDALLHHRGAVQGGIVAMIADSTAGYAALTLLDESAGEDRDDMATLEFKTSFLAPVTGDTVRCVAEIVSCSRTIAFCTAQVFSETGGECRLCALASLTFKRLSPRGTSSSRIEPATRTLEVAGHPLVA